MDAHKVSQTDTSQYINRIGFVNFVLWRHFQLAYMEKEDIGDRFVLFPLTETASFSHSTKSHDPYPSMLPHHSPILGRHQIQIHRLLLPIPDITDHDRDTKTVTPAYRRIIDYTTYSLTAATLLFP